MDVVISHLRSDFDAIGATVAAAKAFPGAVPVVQETLDDAVQAFVALHKDALGLRHLNELDPAAVRRVIVVDTANPERLGPLGERIKAGEVETLVFDHHPVGEGDLPARRVRVGAATTILVRKLEHDGVMVSAIEATAMALGIYADTGNLTYPSTRPDDARAVAWLLERGAELDVVSEYLQEALGPKQQAMLQALLPDAVPERIHGYAVLLAGTTAPDYVEGVAGVLHKLIELVNVDIAVLVVEMGRRTQFVLRSRLPQLDLRPVLDEFEVRGHPQACSGHAKRLPLDEALSAVRARLDEVLPPEPVASDLMSAPVRTTMPDASVGEVRERLLRYGHGALVVVEGDASLPSGHRLAGIVSRRDLDRAAHHGLGDAPVAEVMTREVITASPDAALSDLEALVLANDVGRIPIVRGEAVLGVVTRSDLLRVRGKGRDQAVAPAVSEWARRLRELWPENWLTLLARVGELAGDRPLYLVGGAVRDLLLERRNLDVDLVVEGEAIAFAREVATALEPEMPGLQLTAHAPFGTARLALPDGRKLDFATARTEFYTHPAALPTVEFSSIKQDLARRDFSVNALALRVDPRHFGELLDFFGGREDLDQRELRVLHNLSFVEDPTRLLRAIRFEFQLGCRLAPESVAYARFAMASGTFDGLNGERIKQELRRLLLRDDPVPAMRRMAELDAWRMIHPGIQPDARTWSDLRSLRRVLRGASLDQDPLRWLTYLARMLRPLPIDDARDVLLKLHVAGSESRAVIDMLTQADRLLDAGEVLVLAPADLVLALKTGPEVALAFLATMAASRPQRRVLARYWREWRPVKLSVDGNDLKALGLPPGPRYAAILRKVLDARLAGTVRTPADERALLERLAADEGARENAP